MSRFNEFWKAYPRKVSKFRATRIFEKLEKDEPEVIEKVIEGLKNYVNFLRSEGTKAVYILHPSTFLNQRRWEDEYEVNLGSSQPTTKQVMQEKGIGDEWDRRYEELQRNKKLDSYMTHDKSDS